MGVSVFASWRHLHVVVMAPALTEAGQNQNKPTVSLQNLLDRCELSPSLVSTLHPDCRVPKLVLAAGGNTKFAFTTHDYPETLKAHGGLKHFVQTVQTPPGSTPAEAQESSMSHNAPMGDESHTMGLLKSSTQGSQDGQGSEPTPTTSQGLETNLNNMKASSEMDQLLKNFTAAMSNDMSAGDFPAPNVEELLQAINSMENTEPSEAAEAEIFSGTDLTSFERDLLDNVDMMTNFEDPIPDTGLDVEKETETGYKLEEVMKRQCEAERKRERLQRRLKKLQARTIGKHVSGELMALFEHAHSLAKEGCQGAATSCVNKDKRMRGVSEFTLMHLVQRLSSSSAVSGAARYRPTIKYFGSGSEDLLDEPSSLPGSIVPKLSVADKEEVHNVAEQLETQVHAVQSQVDSDVTASSSGGESCDEMQMFNNPHQSHKSIGKRALWRWSLDRAAVASRWAWLQAQISDLEFRIRQHTEYHRQIRANKGPVVSEELPCRTTPPISVNGYHGALPGGVGIPTKPTEESLNGTIPSQCDPVSSASRIRPLANAAFRKRKLLHAAGLHLVSKKAARPVTVRCGCRPPQTSCVLCTGRTDPVQSVTLHDRPDVTTVAERISVLDAAYHPVLSFPSDASLTVHLDSVMRLQDWQARALRTHTKYNNKFNVHIKDKEYDRDKERRPRLKKKLSLAEQRRKHAAAVLSAKLKKKLTNAQRKRREHLPLPLLKIKKARKHSVRSNLDESEDDGELYVETISVDGRSSPEAAGHGVSAKRERDRSEDSRKRMREDDSYDIDNIVIPYSMAASTRVERLQYKEILTPKWRVVDTDQPPPTAEDEDTEQEDTSEEAFIERHLRSEEAEKRKFMSYMKLPLAVRARSSRRTDSRAESSGANTPDPMSPATLEGAASPLTTPPATPGSVLDEQATPAPAPVSTPSASSNIASAASAVLCRKRTVSSSRWQRQELRVSEDRCPTPDHVEDEVLPYELREYPLSDTVYQEMLRSMPDDHTQYLAKQSKLSWDTGLKEFNSHMVPESPSTSSTISALEEDPNDPNDPEWTVVDDGDDEERTKR